MKKKLLCILWCGSALGQISPHIITFFIRPLPASLRLSGEQKSGPLEPPQGKEMRLAFFIPVFMCPMQEPLEIRYRWPSNI